MKRYKQLDFLNEKMEFFSLFRIKKKEACGYPLFYNDKFINEFVKILKNSPKLKNSADEIEEKIKSGKINIGYSTSNIIKDLYKSFKKSLSVYLKISSTSYFTIMGQFCPVDKSIYIYLDENADIFGTPFITTIEEVLIHELSHYFANNNPVTYTSVCFKSLLNFYINLLKEMDEEHIIKWNNKDIAAVKKLILKLIILESNNKIKDDALIKKIIKEWKECLINLCNNNDEYVNKLLYNLFLSYLSTQGNISLTDKNIAELKINLDNFRSAYLNAFREINWYALSFVMYGQEILFPSEVIAVKNSTGAYEEIKKLLEMGI